MGKGDGSRPLSVPRATFYGNYDALDWGNAKRGEYDGAMDKLRERVTEDDNGCWVSGWSLNEAGYSRVTFRGVVQYAHRLAYEAVKGPIPEEMTIDHLCRNRACVNPEHLDVCTHAENRHRATMDCCRRGHALEDNMVQGTRKCLTCHRHRARRNRAKRHNSEHSGNQKAVSSEP